MPVYNNQVTVTDSPTALNAEDYDGANIYVRTEDAVYLGNSTVTISNGYLIDADENFQYFLGPGEVLYAVIEEGTTTAYVLMTLVTE